MLRHFAVVMTGVLLSVALQAQEPAGAGQRERFRPARVVSVTEVHNADPILGVSSGIVVLEVKVDENGKMEGVTARRDIEPLTPHVARWVQEWTFAPARLNGKRIASIVTVAAAVSPSGLYGMGSALPAAKESPDASEREALFRPPQVLDAIYPGYPLTNLISGAAAVEATISETGEVGDIKVLRDVAPLTSAATSAIKGWKFQAATLRGKPVAAKVVLALVYRSPTHIP